MYWNVMMILPGSIYICTHKLSLMAMFLTCPRRCRWWQVPAYLLSEFLDLMESHEDEAMAGDDPNCVGLVVDGWRCFPLDYNILQLWTSTILRDFHWNRWIIFQENGDILDFQSEVTTIWRSDFTDVSLKLTSFWEVLYPWCYRKIDRKIGFRWMRFSEGRWSISRSSHDP